MYYILLAMILLFGLVFGNQCSRTELTPFNEVAFLRLSENPYRLMPPIVAKQSNKIIFLLDMSYSMVSGKCPHDVDSLDFDYFGTLPGTEFPYDPNKNVGNPKDIRAAGIDCLVDTERAISKDSIDNPREKEVDLDADPPQLHKTHRGIDFEGDRIAMLLNWLREFREKTNNKTQDETSVLIIPFSGEANTLQQQRLITELSKIINTSKFYRVSEHNLLENYLRELKSIHQKHYDNAVEPDSLWSYKDRLMGLSSIGAYAKLAFDRVYQEMIREIESAGGDIANAKFQVITISDGRVTPLKENFRKALGLLGSFCGAAVDCLIDPNCTTGQTGAGALCAEAYALLRESWGDPKWNELSLIDSHFSSIPKLPMFFGNGQVFLNFIELKPTRNRAIDPSDTLFDELRRRFQSRNQRFDLSSALDDKLPIQTIGFWGKKHTLKLTDFFVLNMNFRYHASGRMLVDSDSDGLPDELEESLGFNPTVPRSNGWVLDSIMADPRYRETAQTLVNSKTCDPTWDADGDGLNECEEILLKTSPLDIDTDGDGIPDLFEWLYGYNPIQNDIDVDSNGDGVLNKTKFSLGLPPQVKTSDVHESNLIRFEVNFMGMDKIISELLGEIQSELYKIKVNQAPVRTGRVSSAPSVLYYLKQIIQMQHREKSKIPVSRQFIAPIQKSSENNLVLMARTIDLEDATRRYWYIKKIPILVTSGALQIDLDLASFELIPTLDP